jgi:hypothetical protein
MKYVCVCQSIRWMHCEGNNGRSLDWRSADTFLSDLSRVFRPISCLGLVIIILPAFPVAILRLRTSVRRESCCAFIALQRRRYQGSVDVDVRRQLCNRSLTERKRQFIQVDRKKDILILLKIYQKMTANFVARSPSLTQHACTPLRETRASRSLAGRAFCSLPGCPAIPQAGWFGMSLALQRYVCLPRLKSLAECGSLTRISLNAAPLKSKAYF